jgi:hypothetical protein
MFEEIKIVRGLKGFNKRDETREGSGPQATEHKVFTIGIGSIGDLWGFKLKAIISEAWNEMIERII